MKLQDERIIQLNNKIQSEAYRVALFLAGGSVFIKAYVLRMPFAQYAVELGVLVLTTVYVIVRSMLLGHDFVSGSKPKSGKGLAIAGGVIFSLAAGISGGIRNYTLYGDKYTGVFDGHFIVAVAFIFVSSAVFAFAFLFLLFWCNKKGQQRIEKKLKEEEEEKG